MKKNIDKNEIMKKGNKVFSEFKDFIARGNGVDLAVGVIIGSAFGKIVTSIVNDILMPLIGIVIGGINFTGLTFKIGEATINRVFEKMRIEGKIEVIGKGRNAKWRKL